MSKLDFDSVVLDIISMYGSYACQLLTCANVLSLFFLVVVHGIEFLEILTNVFVKVVNFFFQ